MRPVQLALLGAAALGCAAIPPTLPPEQDPSSSRAAEAPPPMPSKTLAADPPPRAALEAPAVSAGMHGAGGQASSGQEHQHGEMAKPDAGMSKQQPQHHQHPGATTPADAGPVHEQHEHHHGAMDGGMP